jgi:hypothetical protein
MVPSQGGAPVAECMIQSLNPLINNDCTNFHPLLRTSQIRQKIFAG